MKRIAVWALLNAPEHYVIARWTGRYQPISSGTDFWSGPPRAAVQLDERTAEVGGGEGTANDRSWVLAAAKRPVASAHAAKGRRYPKNLLCAMIARQHNAAEGRSGAASDPQLGFDLSFRFCWLAGYRCFGAAHARNRCRAVRIHTVAPADARPRERRLSDCDAGWYRVAELLSPPVRSQRCPSRVPSCPYPIRVRRRSALGRGLSQLRRAQAPAAGPRHIERPGPCDHDPRWSAALGRPCRLVVPYPAARRLQQLVDRDIDGVSP
jgi:hypothetical protein